MAIGYEPLNESQPFVYGGPLAEAQWIEVDVAAGSIASTPTDMAKYMRMLLNRGALAKGRLVSDESFKLFMTPAIDSPFRGEPAEYGYGVWVSDIAGHTRPWYGDARGPAARAIISGWHCAPRRAW